MLSTTPYAQATMVPFPTTGARQPGVTVEIAGGDFTVFPQQLNQSVVTTGVYSPSTDPKTNSIEMYDMIFVPHLPQVVTAFIGGRADAMVMCDRTLSAFSVFNNKNRPPNGFDIREIYKFVGVALRPCPINNTDRSSKKMHVVMSGMVPWYNNGNTPVQPGTLMTWKIPQVTTYPNGTQQIKAMFSPATEAGDENWIIGNNGGLLVAPGEWGEMLI